MHEHDLFSTQDNGQYLINPAELNVLPNDFTLLIEKITQEARIKKNKEKEKPIVLELGDEPLLIKTGEKFKWTFFKVGYERVVSKPIVVKNGFDFAQIVGKVEMKAIPKRAMYKYSPIWAECNLGASSPEGIGLFFVWGETIGKETFDEIKKQKSEFLTGKIDTLKKEGIINEDNSLLREHDAAQVQIGDGWRLPKYEEIKNLVENCTFETSKLNEVPCLVVRGKEEYQNNTIFLPLCGIYTNGKLPGKGTCGGIWTANVNKTGSAAKLMTYFESASAYYEMQAHPETAVNIRPVKDV